MQNPPNIEGGQRRPLSDQCHVIVHETDEGLALVIDNKDPRDITLRFDFSASSDLEMKCAPEVEDAGVLRCNTVSMSGTAINLCELIVKEDATSFSMKYRVQCLVQNAQTGELEQVGPPRGPGGPAERAAAGAVGNHPTDPSQAEVEAKKQAALKELIQREVTIRIKIEAEWYAYYLRIVKIRGESMCNLCKARLQEGQETVDYKEYRLHKQCFDAAPKCHVCGDILIGEYVQTKGDGVTAGLKLHKACIDEYKKGTRPKCTACGKQIMEQKWVTTPDGKHYHSECRKA